jgi:hypothetical protein
MKHSAKVMSLALGLAMTGGMAPQALAKTPQQTQGQQMTHKASKRTMTHKAKRTKAYSGKRSKNKTVTRTTTVMPGVKQGL